MTTVEQLWELKPSRIHGTGVFARARIPAETRLSFTLQNDLKF